jgi:hypothetical protein
MYPLKILASKLWVCSCQWLVDEAELIMGSKLERKISSFRITDWNERERGWWKNVLEHSEKNRHGMKNYPNTHYWVSKMGTVGKMY